MTEKLSLCKAGRALLHILIIFGAQINMKMRFAYSSSLLLFPVMDFELFDGGTRLFSSVSSSGISTHFSLRKGREW